MKYAKVLVGFLLVGSIAVAVGDDLTGGPAEKDEMKPPPRPAELDMLDMFVGSWTGEGEMKMPGETEVMKSTSSTEMKWALDKRYLVENMTMKMGEGMEMSFIGIWTWDAKIGKYRNWWFDSFGTWGTGTSTYDKATKTWSMEAKGTDPMSGKPTWGAGSFKFTDSSTTEGTWKEWHNAKKTGDAMEMKFKSTRK